MTEYEPEIPRNDVELGDDDQAVEIAEYEDSERPPGTVIREEEDGPIDIDEYTREEQRDPRNERLQE